ncbi:hypothetical protein Poli38472_003861 [Pythium oligandrum]|uniref:Aspartylglucosaminidase n=1 Tax=Pythium oligandrum TaxID=41045 RepID=A0A8K1CM00_PYTOL|nr:hypothetical protein Poli38472_003861 [Pythium oligandrum]|eukprot:TMW66096.1 hypothetical protein Poli38472_003861 [Pythium oligandrum]
MRRLAVLFATLLSYGRVHGAVVINTWPFTNATASAFQALTQKSDQETTRSLDAITAGCNRCEVDQCDFTVGYGGSPDTNGETTLDAMILDGDTMDMGAVAQLRRVKSAIHVARAVMDHSAHSVLAGDGALAFAKMMGFHEESLETPRSRAMYEQWRDHQCQPNYYRNVVGQNTSCPPYAPAFSQLHARSSHAQELISTTNHDTIGMIVLDDSGSMTAGTSSNGANHKIAGRVGDAAIPGAGAYVDSRYGGAAATGDGDIMMRFLPSFHAVQEMARGVHPRVACESAMARIARVFPHFKGGMVCLNRLGEYGGAGHGWKFSYSVQTSDMEDPTVVPVDPIALE